MNSAPLEVCKLAKGLRGQFELLQAELATIESRCISDISKRCPSGVNPAKLLERIRSARTEADQLETEADQMLDEKAQIVESIQKLLLSNRNAVLQLQRILPSENKNDMLDPTFCMQDFSTLAVQWRENMTAGGMPVYDPASASLVPAPLSSITNLTASVPTAVPVTTSAPSAEKAAPAETGSTDSTFPEDTVMEQELEQSDPRSAVSDPIETFVNMYKGVFEQLPDSIRGRCTIQQIAHLYHIVHQYFDNDLRRPPLTTQKLTSLGAKVIGQTGQASLNCLRHLKLIDLSKQGVSLVQS